MHRFFVLVLLALLPLQFSWAAVAAYCGHEAPAAAPHFGHHEHQHPHAPSQHGEGHGAGDKTAGVDDADLAAALDPAAATDLLCLDCGHCHGQGGALAPWPAPLPDPLPALHPATGPDEASMGGPLARPERPQWPALA